MRKHYYRAKRCTSSVLKILKNLKEKKIRVGRNNKVLNDTGGFIMDV